LIAHRCRRGISASPRPPGWGFTRRGVVDERRPVAASYVAERFKCFERQQDIGGAGVMSGDQILSPKRRWLVTAPPALLMPWTSLCLTS